MAGDLFLHGQTTSRVGLGAIPTRPRELSESMKRRIPVRTLVIDDDERVCRDVQRLLSDAQHDVMTFTKPEEGLQLAAKLPCQLALVDLRLREHDGAEIIASLAGLSPQTRVVAMSAFPDTPQVLDAVRAGARDLVNKPIQRDALLAALERQLAEVGITGLTEADFNQRLGRRLRALRTEAGLTLNDVAEPSGITAAQLSQIELGKNATTTWTLARLGGTLRMPLSKLVADL